MSRIGNRILKIPTACDVEVSAGNVVISGPRGRLTCPYVPRYVAVKQNRQQQTLAVTRRRLTKHAKQLHGTTNALLNNHLVGVTQGWQKVALINGVGFRARLQKSNLEMKLGFSHPVIFSPPVTVTLTVPKPTTIIIDGCDRQQVGLVAAQIKAFYPIEPYKGKGIYIQGESVIRKEAKSSAK